MAGAPFAPAEKHIGERPFTMLLAADDTAAKIMKSHSRTWPAALTQRSIAPGADGHGIFHMFEANMNRKLREDHCPH